MTKGTVEIKKPKRMCDDCDKDGTPDCPRMLVRKKQKQVPSGSLVGYISCAKSVKGNEMTHFNKLTPAEAERLALLSEELGEAQQAIGKILRHGYESTHPDGGPTNRKMLERELGDVSFAMVFMGECGDIDEAHVEDMKRLKNLKVGRYFHHQEI